MSRYVEFRAGIVNNRTERANVVQLDDLYKHIDPFKDCYRSLFYYDSAILEHITKNNTISGFRGKVGIDRLVFDFDHQDLELARKDAVLLIDRLLTQYDIKSNEIGIFFSGRKGFAIELKVNGLTEIDNQLDANLPYLVKRVCLTLAEGLDSADRVIYNHNRLYRINGTLHQNRSVLNGIEVQLFKTSISETVLRNSSIDDIKQIATKLSVPIDFDIISNVSKINTLIAKVKENINKVVRELPNNIPTNSNGLPDDNLAPKGQKICIWRLSQGTVTESRNNSLLRIAVHDKNLGLPKEVVKGKLTGVATLMKANNPEKDKLDPITEGDIELIVNQAFNNPYDYGCLDPVLSSVCSRKCYLAPKVFPDQASSFTTFSEALDKASNFYRKYYDVIVPTGLTSIDSEMPLFLGTFNLIIGLPGTGKTSVLLNIIRNAAKANIPLAFFNMDMSEEMLIQRFAPILIVDEQGRPKMSGKQFMERYARGDNALIKEAKEAFEKLSEEALLSSRSNLTVADIRKEIEMYEAMSNKKLKLIVLDYVQLLKSDKDGLYANSTFNAEALKELSKEKNVCIIGLSQTQRSGGSDQELGLAAGKGSGAWEENASTQINCWRPFSLKRPEQDWVITLKMAKNRLGATNKVDLFWHGPSGYVRDLAESEQMQLVALREQVEHEEQ